MSENRSIPNETDFKNAFRDAKKTKLWRGSIEERKQKIQALHDKLNAIYGKNIHLEFFGVEERFNNVQGASGASAYIQPLNIIAIARKISVITFMQLWLRALGVDNVSAVEISRDIFEEVFPVSAKKIVCINGLYVQTSDANNDPNNDTLSDSDNAPD